jgi:dicarboxylate transporter 10
MCADGVKPPADRFRYVNVLDGLFRAVKEEGVASLYRGLGPNVMRSVVMSESGAITADTSDTSSRHLDISQLAAYDTIKSSLLATSRLGLKDDVKTHLLSGVLAGTIATTAAAPFDVLKSRIQSSAGKAVSGVLYSICCRSSGLRETPLGYGLHHS